MLMTLTIQVDFTKALHSELLTELSSRFSSRNEYFVISELRVEHHFFIMLMTLTIQVDFTNQPFGRKHSCIGSHYFDAIQFHQQNNTQKTQLEVLPNFYDFSSVIYAKRSIVHLLLQKLLI